jgi:hypothetical protein
MDNRRDPKGRVCGFEIRGVSVERFVKYSQRSGQRGTAIERFTAESRERSATTSGRIVCQSTPAYFSSVDLQMSQ